MAKRNTTSLPPCRLPGLTLVPNGTVLVNGKLVAVLKIERDLG